MQVKKSLYLYSTLLLIPFALFVFRFIQHNYEPYLTNEAYKAIIVNESAETASNKSMKIESLSLDESTITINYTIQSENSMYIVENTNDSIESFTHDNKLYIVNAISPQYGPTGPYSGPKKFPLNLKASDKTYSNQIDHELSSILPGEVNEVVLIVGMIDAETMCAYSFYTKYCNDSDPEGITDTSFDLQRRVHASHKIR